MGGLVVGGGVTGAPPMGGRRVVSRAGGVKL
jgi:hypothetical protein